METAYAKINLALHVRGRRPDGYHALETVFAFCTDGDVLRAEPADTLSLAIDGPFADGLSATDNLVLRAAGAMGLAASFRLTKNLPIASGIGGGSADAAAALRLLARMHGVALPDLTTLRSIGADVPACVASITAHGSGVGDILSDEKTVSGTPVLLVNPGVSLSTAQVFAGWDGVDRGPLRDWRAGRNDLEPAAISLVPRIGELLDRLRAWPDVTLARMSGSGATCFALFDTIEKRSMTAGAVRAAFPGYWTMESVLR